MTTAVIFHEIEDGAVWAKAWINGPGSRHELLGKPGITCRNFRDPNDPNPTGVRMLIEFTPSLPSRLAA